MTMPKDIEAHATKFLIEIGEDGEWYVTTWVKILDENRKIGTRQLNGKQDGPVSCLMDLLLHDGNYV